MKNRLLLIMSALVLSVGTTYGATAAKGVFTVNAQGKKVQFANANSVYSEKELIQWSHLPDAIEAGWDVLTGEEWSYLLASGRTDAEDKNALGTVDGMKGLIILPDEWSQPSGAPTFQPVDVTGISYEYNVYTAAEWSLMADAGAVFLPCGGYGYYDPYDEGKYKELNKDDHGSYWAKDEYASNPDHAHCMRFNTDGEGSIHDLNHQDKTTFYSVILVREAPVASIILDEMDELAAYTAKWNTAKGKNFAYVNRTLKKDGTFYTLCLPFDVPDIEASPLAGAEVFTFDGGTVSGTAGSEVLNLNMSTLVGTRLTRGVPYILRWPNTGETLETPLFFEGVENWDTDTDADTDSGNETIKYHGMYPRAHVPGYKSGDVSHYNFYIGANNTLYWPDDKLYPNSKLKGFRAYFYIVQTGSSEAPVRQGTQAVWKISSALGSATGINNGEWLMVNGECQKILQNGQIILIINGEKYTIGGIKLNE